MRAVNRNGNDLVIGKLQIISVLMTSWYLTSLLTLFKSYLVDERMTMKGSVQRSTVQP